MKIKIEWDSDEEKAEGLAVLGAAFRLDEKDQTQDNIEELLKQRMVPGMRAMFMRGLIQRSKTDPLGMKDSDIGPGARGVREAANQFLGDSKK